MTDIFVDLTAANDGDGTLPTHAASAGAPGARNKLNTFTTSSGDVVWIRRKTDGKSGLTANMSLESNVSYIGWPKGGDSFYYHRPDSAISAGWDSDTEERFELTAGSSRIIESSALKNVTFSRIKFTNTSTVHSVYLHHGSNSGISFFDCNFDSSVGSNTDLCVYVVGSYISFINTQISGSVDSTGNDYIVYVNGNHTVFDNVAINLGEINDPSDGYGVYINGNDVVLKDVSVNCAIGGSEHALRLQGSRWLVDNLVWHEVGKSSNNKFQLDYSEIDMKITGLLPSFYTFENENSVVKIDSVHKHNLQVESLSKVDYKPNTTSGTITVNGGLMVEGHQHTGKPFSIGSDGYAISVDENGIPGTWRMQFSKGELVASTPKRTGGADYSLRAHLYALDNSRPDLIWLGKRDMHEAYWVTMPAGSASVSIFGAHKFMSLKKTGYDFFIELEYVKEDGFKRVLSSRGMPLVPDNSIWDGDTDLTGFKIELPTNFDKETVCNLRIIANPKEVSPAYFYLDPTPVVSS